MGKECKQALNESLFANKLFRNGGSIENNSSVDGSGVMAGWLSGCFYLKIAMR